MVRALFVSLTASLLAGCVVEPAGDVAEQDLMPASVSTSTQGDHDDISDAPGDGEPESNTIASLAGGTDLPFKHQIPVDSKLKFVDTRTNDVLLKVAVSGTQPPPDYTARTEYWSRLRPVKASVLSMESVGFAGEPGTPAYDKDFDDWLSGGNVIATAQEVSPLQWIEGEYVPQAPHNALYWAVDPDAPSTGRIGLLLERDGQDELLSMTWYRTNRRMDGQIFETLPSKLKFTQVQGIDPDTIKEATWYYIHCAMRPE
ncbi:hypothetical protein [Sorangium sp. So ce1335]|uniref:hypothetical protein n=1 Tax=Sorangium sp. So ce1335 TaxID=3133335 RepID=UPI003F63E449